MRRYVENALTLVLLSCITADAGSYALGPFGFTNAPVSYPQFSSSSGYLHSVTLEVTNLVVHQDIIMDNDSTNSLTYKGTLHQYVDMIGWPAPPFPLSMWYGPFVKTATNLDVPFNSTDDGDGPGARDGGNDESLVQTVFSNLCGQIVLSDSENLWRHTGDGTIPLVITRFMNTIGLSVGVYPTNELYMGSVFVRYDFADTPLSPRVASMSVQSNAVSFVIHDLSVGSSNTVQRSFDLRSGIWSNVGAFVSSTWAKEWTGLTSNGWGTGFYRIKSE